eukprot:scaffold202571_cov35-Attheya_sp.AAC.1
MQASEYPPGSLNEIVVSLLRISTCKIGQQDRRLDPFRDESQSLVSHPQQSPPNTARSTSRVGQDGIVYLGYQ